MGSSDAGLGEDEDTSILAKPFEQVLLTAQEDVKDELLVMVKEEIDIFDGIVDDSCQPAAAFDTRGGSNQMMKEYGCVKQESVKCEPCGVVSFTIKQEVHHEWEDDAYGEGVDPCATRAAAETAAGDNMLVEKMTFEDDLVFSGDVSTGTARSNELLQKGRVCTLFEEDAKLSRLKDVITLSSSSSGFPTQLEISSSNFERDYFQPAQVIPHKTFPSDTVEDESGLHRCQERFSCSLCPSTFSFKCGLKSHMRIHTGEKPFSCLFCLKAFNRKDTLEKHVRTHTGEKPFSCALCPAKFTCRGNLAAHKRKHTGEKPYTCSLCSLKFCRKESLEIHLRIHTGEKPFSCSLCASKFTQRSHVKIHMRKHTGEKPFSCSLCFTKFSHKGGMNRHLRTAHCCP